MKRSFRQVCEDSTLPTPTDRLRLTILPYNVLFLVMDYLDAVDLQSLMRCLIIEYNIRAYSPNYADLSLFPEETVRCLSNLQERLSTLLPSLYDCCVRNQMGAVHNSTCSVEASLPISTESMKLILERVRAISTNTYYPLMYFVDTEICERCSEALGAVRYWSQTRPMDLCYDCHLHLEDHKAHTLKPSIYLSDGYAWVAPQVFKELCGVPTSVKASIFAMDRGIRTHSRASYDYDDALEKFPRFKDYYFLMDIVPFYKTLG